MLAAVTAPAPPAPTHATALSISDAIAVLGPWAVALAVRGHGSLSDLCLRAADRASDPAARRAWHRLSRARREDLAWRLNAAGIHT